MPSAWPESLPQPIGKARRETPYRYRTIFLTVVDVQTPNFGTAEPVRLFQYRLEHRRKVAGRGVDDLQHFGGRGLLFQRLSRLGQEPRVLHSNDRLRSEVLQQRDLLVGEGTHLAAIDNDCAEETVILAQC